jgi:hypothetical protein
MDRGSGIDWMAPVFPGKLGERTLLAITKP